MEPSYSFVTCTGPTGPYGIEAYGMGPANPNALERSVSMPAYTNNAGVAAGICGNGGCVQPGLLLCSQCGTKAYCSEMCQRSHWREHRDECRVLLDQKKATVANGGSFVGSSPPSAGGSMQFPVTPSANGQPAPGFPAAPMVVPMPMGGFASAPTVSRGGSFRAAPGVLSRSNSHSRAVPHLPQQMPYGVMPVPQQMPYGVTPVPQPMPYGVMPQPMGGSFSMPVPGGGSVQFCAVPAPGSMQFAVAGAPGSVPVMLPPPPMGMQPSPVSLPPPPTMPGCENYGAPQAGGGGMPADRRFNMAPLPMEGGPQPVGGSLSVPPGVSAGVTSGACGNVGCQRLATLLCTQCAAVVYCSPECQREHWRTHKVECRAALAEMKRSISSRALPNNGVVQPAAMNGSAFIGPCGHLGCQNGGTLVCGQCHGVAYCSPHCQRNDWEQHKRGCAMGAVNSH